MTLKNRVIGIVGVLGLVGCGSPVDSSPPVITLKGGSTITVEQGLAYVDSGAEARDDRHGTITVRTSGSVDTSTAGTYTITYTATDKAENTATATLLVTVADQTEPVITITGANPKTVAHDSTYTDPSATALDAMPWMELTHYE